MVGNVRQENSVSLCCINRKEISLQTSIRVV